MDGNLKTDSQSVMARHDSGRHAASWVSRFLFLTGLIGIAIVGFILRIWGINWGLPHGARLGSYHPDELLVVSAASSIDIARGQINPHFFNYPSFFIYLSGLACAVGAGWRLIDLGHIEHIYLTVRSLSVLFGAAAVFAVCSAGCRFAGYHCNIGRKRFIGLTAACLMAIAPLHIQYSHYAAVDVAAVFFVAAALAVSIGLLRDVRLKTCVFAGALAGFAAGTKYNCGIVLLAVLAAIIISADVHLDAQRRLRFALLAILAAGAAFLFSTPAAVLWPKEFAKGLAYELSHAASGHGYVFANTGPGWLYTMRSSLAWGLGWPLMIAGIAGVVWSIIRHRREDILLLSFVLPYYALISLSEVKFARYSLPLFPPLVIMAASVASDSSRALRSVSVRCIAGLIGILIVGSTLLYVIALDSLFTQPDPRDRAAKWARQYIPSGASIAFPTVPWFYSPPFAPGFGALRKQDRYAAMAASGFRLLADPEKDWNVGLLREEKPDYVFISDFEMQDALRVGVPEAEEYMRYLEQSYQGIAVFQSRLWPAFLFPKGTIALPHDMRYPAPRIEVFRRKWPD